MAKLLTYTIATALLIVFYLSFVVILRFLLAQIGINLPGPLWAWAGLILWAKTLVVWFRDDKEADKQGKYIVVLVLVLAAIISFLT